MVAINQNNAKTKFIVMVVADQPTCFDDSLVVKVSSKTDGTMRSVSAEKATNNSIKNRRDFCQLNGMVYEDMVYQNIAYLDDSSYCEMVSVDENSTVKHKNGIIGDALITKAINIGLMLPVADCIPAIVYDKQRRILALLHLGRHSTVAKLAEKVILSLIKDGSTTSDITVWMGSSIKQQSYAMKWFDNSTDPEWSRYCLKDVDGYHLDLAGFNADLFSNAGVKKSNIHISAVNTATDPNYYSHYAGDTSDRFMVVAMMK